MEFLKETPSRDVLSTPVKTKYFKLGLLTKPWVGKLRQHMFSSICGTLNHSSTLLFSHNSRSANNILVLEMLTHSGCIFLFSSTDFLPVISRNTDTEQH